MPEKICPKCGKHQHWYEPIKIDPTSKKSICRKCNTPFDKTNIIPVKVQEKENGEATTKRPMNYLVTEIINSFNKLRKTQQDITSPSIPLPYLGNLNQYTSSYPKVITVGLNPSKKEFPSNSPFIRFKKAETLDFSKSINNDDITTYLNLLNKYFQDKPEKMYNAYNPILEGLNTSFNNNAKNSALHTNMCSPFATDVTWSKLSSSSKYTLNREGRKFWHRLVEIIEPDIILFSVDKRYLKRVKINKSGWKIFKKVTEKADGKPRIKPYNILITRARVNSKKMFLVNGPPSYLPFGPISNDEKHSLGDALTKLIK